MKPTAPADHERQTMARRVIDRLDTAGDQIARLDEQFAHLHRLINLGTVSATVVHEFNNLLTPIVSYTQLALAHPDDAELRDKALRRVHDAGQRAARACESLLGFTRAAEPDAAAEADLAATVDEALACLGRDLAKDGIDLRVALPDARVAMPAIRLQQVLVNLLLNARKAIGKRGGRIRIAGRVDGPDRVTLTVADSGPGIPPAIRDRLFEPFVTHAIGDDADTQPGSGLGLALCRQLVLEAGGRIEAHCRPAEGATFELTLPLAA